MRADPFRPESDGETARRASRRWRDGFRLLPVLLALIASAGPGAAQTVRIERLLDRPIIRPDMDASMGSNIAGPSLIRVPDWAEGALGRYYLYFADHRGTYIRLAWADALEGPWTTHEPGVLDLADSHFPTTCPPCAPPGAYVHIASPDVHVVDERQEIVMYIHGRDAGRQVTRAAVSRRRPALRGEARDPGAAVLPRLPARRLLVRPGHARRRVPVPGRPLRLRGGADAVQPRHAALGPPEAGRLAARVLYAAGRRPEHVLQSRIDLAGDWLTWSETPPVEVLRPERDWEGAGLPVEPSRGGAIDVPVNQLRDPAIYEEDGRAWLLYTVAGERGIALAEVHVEP